MAEKVASPKPPVAMLSAAAPAGEASVALLPLLGGHMLIEEQIDALRAIGVERYLIEVDIVPGALLTLVDALRKSGLTIDFVRTFGDLRGKLSLQDRLLVQDEGVIASAMLLKMVVAEPGSVIATVDDREENADYERMDLNTRWSGLSLFDTQILAAAGDVPDDWSLASSLLRTAMQRNTPMRLMRQGYLQQGDLRKIVSQQDADRFSRALLASRGSEVSGLLESRIFAPLGRAIAPAIWRAKAGATAISGAMMTFGAGAFGLASYGYAAGASAAALVAAALQAVRTVTGSPGKAEKAITAFGWALLAATMLGTAWVSGERNVSALFAPTMSLGLIGISRLSILPDWARQLLLSPSLVALALLVMLAFTSFGTAIGVVATVQMTALLAALLYLHRKAAKTE